MLVLASPLSLQLTRATGLHEDKDRIRYESGTLVGVPETKQVEAYEGSN